MKSELQYNEPFMQSLRIMLRQQPYRDSTLMRLAENLTIEEGLSPKDEHAVSAALARYFDRCINNGYIDFKNDDPAANRKLFIDRLEDIDRRALNELARTGSRRNFIKTTAATLGIAAGTGFTGYNIAKKQAAQQALEGANDLPPPQKIHKQIETENDIDHANYYAVSGSLMALGSAIYLIADNIAQSQKNSDSVSTYQNIDYYVHALLDHSKEILNNALAVERTIRRNSNPGR